MRNCPLQSSPLRVALRLDDTTIANGDDGSLRSQLMLYYHTGFNIRCSTQLALYKLFVSPGCLFGGKEGEGRGGPVFASFCL